MTAPMLKIEDLEAALSEAQHWVEERRVESERLEQQVAQQAATISQLRNALEQIAFWTKNTGMQAIYTTADAALASLPKELP